MPRRSFGRLGRSKYVPETLVAPEPVNGGGDEGASVADAPHELETDGYKELGASQ